MTERTLNLTNDVTGEDDVTIVSEGVIEVTNGKKCVVDMSEQMVSKRTRLSYCT